MIEIPLTRGMVALVDDADLPMLMHFSWRAIAPYGRHARSPRSSWYAQARVPGSGSASKSIFMHHVVLPGVPRVDHKNADGLDNRRENLRAATGTQNNANMRKPRRGSSRFKGVSWSKELRRWRAGICCSSRHVHLGYFADETVAARAYNVAALELFGEFARLNEIPAAEALIERAPEPTA